MVAAEAVDDVCNTALAFGSLSAEIEQYDKVIEFLTSIVDNSDISELKEAASQLRVAIQTSYEPYLRDAVILDLVENSIQTGEIVLLSKFGGPYSWVVVLGFGIADLLTGLGAVAEESVRLIGLGHSADVYAYYIRWKFQSDNFTSYHLIKDDDQMQLLQLLSQLRIVGEDKVGKDYDAYGILIEILYFLSGTSQSEVESYLKQSIEQIENIGEKLGYFVTGKFNNAYLEYD